jgi:putative hydrolase of the HAD superfamily
MPRFPEPIRAVVFDAVGTLIQLDPPAGDVYARFAAHFGSRLDAGEIRRRFALAFAAQERNDAERGHRTDEGRELGRWRQIVGEVIDDIDSTPCFQALYDHFTLASSWRCDADAAGLIRELKGRGFVVGMASNFDHRLRAIATGSPELTGLDHLWISSEVGWKKPAEGFFHEVGRTLGTESGHILFVGDDRTNDYDGATAAGMASLLFDPRGRSDLPEERRIARLGDLLALDDLAPRG